MRNPNWTREQLILAFNLYCKIDFGKISKTNPQIIQLAELIGRTPSALGLKLSNLASFDPNLQARGIKGMQNAGKGDRLIFEEFQNNREALVFESENILADMQGLSLENKYQAELPDLSTMAGETRERYVKTRVNQNFFRQMILSNYHSKCAVTGIDMPALLIASHIIPWAENKEERLNPANGICLSALYDKAFDKHLISFDEDYRMILTTNLKEHCTKDYYQTHFGKMEGQEIILPSRGIPSMEFLGYHRVKCDL
ncbi:HNH endonuclease [Ancylomarina euxinus]|uniref:HNH endonuclease n=1 Tax=Ancylomarina euxinus TaxID=2283627 RepID=A0A425Y8D5_9BACT|nr:HNH endonuclease [Ancylomarina euxinus]MCZ4693373.1 HNH endonuclease [Ancylomarina euxinus]MUP13601.1 HNH endonuclease [Ancylomarina euxinus]RRG24753.1 HNH endonuclease [Ancylomarina euxinus]